MVKFKVMLFLCVLAIGGMAMPSVSEAACVRPLKAAAHLVGGAVHAAGHVAKGTVQLARRGRARGARGAGACGAAGKQVQAPVQAPAKAPTQAPVQKAPAPAAPK